MVKRKFQIKSLNRIVEICNENNIPVNGKNVSLGLRFISGDTVDASPAEIERYLLANSYLENRQKNSLKRKAQRNFSGYQDELLNILKRQQKSLLVILLTIPFYSEAQDKIVSELNSYSSVFKAFFDSIVYEVISQSTLDGISIYCGSQESIGLKVDEVFFDHVKKRMLAEGVVTNEIASFQNVTVEKVLEMWRQYQIEHRDIELLLESLRPLFNEERAEAILDRIVSVLYGIGQFELASFLGMKTKKWVTKKDVFVRDLHKQREGLIAPLDGLILGAKYPRDPRLPLEDRENCRCHLEFC